MKHHFVFLRHCVRSESAWLDWGLDANRFSPHGKKYVADPLPDWQVPMHWCTPIAIDMARNTGVWLVDSGIVSTGAQVEFVTDNVQRDVDTTLALSVGIRHRLEVRGNSTGGYDDDDNDVTGLDTIHRAHDVFDTDESGICKYVPEGDKEALQDRLKNLRRPDLDFGQGLALLEKIAGTGPIGKLSHKIPTEPELDFENWSISGAASILRTFARILFYSRAGIESQDFAPDATVEEVYQLLQYVHWFRSIINVDNNWSAMAGAAWAKMILLVLSKGSLFSLPTRQTSAAAVSDTVTIAVGHETQLDMFATVLGVTWDLPEYKTHPEFVPTPPGSGFHIVRDTETDKIEVSYIYPVYHKEGQKYWETNRSGVLKRAPVSWKESNSSSLFESNSQAGLIPSLSHLESHFLSRLGQFRGAMECYDIIADRFAHQQHNEPLSPPPPATEPQSFRSAKTLLSLQVTISLVVVCLLALAVLGTWVQRPFRQSSTSSSSRPSDVKASESSETVEIDGGELA